MTPDQLRAFMAGAEAVHVMWPDGYVRWYGMDAWPAVAPTLPPGTRVFERFDELLLAVVEFTQKEHA